MTDHARVRWILDHDDSAHTRARINDLHDLLAGVIVAHVRPGARRAGHDLLAALDKDPDAAGWPSGAQAAWRLAELWLGAEQSTDLVVYGAQRLHPDDLTRLTGLTGATGATLWLVTSNHVDATVPGRLADLLALAPSSQARPPSRSGPVAASPAVVRDDFVTFRAACWRRLDLTARRAVDDRLVAVMDAMHGRLAACRDLDRWQAGALLEAQLSQAIDQEDAIVVLRGVQLACFEAGYLLQADTVAICDASRLIINARRAPAQAAALRRLTDPVLAAIGALTACTPLDSHRLAGLDLGSVDGDGSHVRTRDASYDLPTAFGGLVRAQRCARQRVGARTDQPFFADRHGARCTPRRIRDLAQRAHQLTLVGRTPRHVDDRRGRHLGDVLTIHPLRRHAPGDARQLQAG